MSCTYGWLGINLHAYTTIKLLLIVFTLLLRSHNSIASHFLEDVKVFEKDGVYHIHITSNIEASAEYVRNVLTDYIHIYRLSDSIIESKVLAPSANNKIQVETVVLCCMPLFCREVTRVEEVSILNSGRLHTRIVPEKSDFRSGEATWDIKPMGSQTQLSYQATLEPDFFIPPLLGTHMVIKNLRKEFSTTFFRVQHIARINEDREWNDNYEFINIVQIPEDASVNTE